MSRIKPLDFQIDAVEEMTETFIRLWKLKERKLPIVLKSPTGSGKTFITTNFITKLNNLPNWQEDKAFIWITFSDDLAMQSKDKFLRYYKNNLSNILLTVNDIDKGKLDKNDILFLNWQKLVSRAAVNRILRRPDSSSERKESGKYFEDFIDGTHIENREIILIIDEAHRNATTNLARNIIDYINPKIILYVTATPNDDLELEAYRKGSLINVERERVVSAGLIKEKIVVQTNEDLKRYVNRDLDETLIDLAIEKRDNLCQQYKELEKNINPLILIQLPNDDNRLIETGQKTKERVVLDYLYKLGIQEEKIALWFDNKQKNMEFITENDSEIEFMIFKQAAGTGWDCPRAHILVMYREINSSTFYVQTIGRILRMAEPQKNKDYNENPDLRTGYLYTNYKREDIKIPDQSPHNLPNYYISKIRPNITNIELESDYISRVDYGDLKDSAKFQKSFIDSMNKYFSIDINDVFGNAAIKLEKKGIDLSPTITNKLVVDAEFEDFDQLNYEYINKGIEIDVEMSNYDIEKTFNYFCYNLLREQTEEDAKISNIARSWGPFKSAIRVWLRQVISSINIRNYKVFINDLNKDSASIFRPAITNAMKEYRPVLEKIVEEEQRKTDLENKYTFMIKDSYSFNEQYTVEETNLCVLQEYYLPSQDYSGKENEQLFKNYIDEKYEVIEWWFKNGNYGKEFYALAYYNTVQKRKALFYPDWIIKFKNGKIGIFDTKSGNTAQTEGRAEGLAKKLIELGENYLGGIVVKENGVWYYNNSLEYEYTPGNLTSEWRKMEDLFKNNYIK